MNSELFRASVRQASCQTVKQVLAVVTGLLVPPIMLENFRAYQNSIIFYRDCGQLKCAKHLRDQLNRAASSISLNLSEGSSQPTSPNRRRFYHMALGSTRECQTILDLANVSKESLLSKRLDQLAGQIYKLCKNQQS